ncbi:lantibiotic immunity ABC transporter MutE/EpiE family permease subunit [Acetobacterium carbinolicum]|uniref:lantibiotic immunity ABC transporter MutE/EpiE family permease subunit n=1 Tax=Acetobacterium carbinolicum TaxID=52690 RepID=UPI0039C9B147
MLAIIKSEFQKSKRSAVNKFVILAPLMTLLLCYFLGGGQNGAYNWWVVMFLPGLIAILAAMVIGRDKNLEYKGLFLYPREKALFWIGKTLYVSLLFLGSSLIFMLGIAMMGLFVKTEISLQANLFAISILILTFLFQIPICMFLADRFNLFVATLFNVGMVILSVVSFGSESIIKYSPYGVGVALMCPILHILPNGLPVPEGSPLLADNGIWSAALGCMLVFIMLVAATAWSFKEREGK